MASWIQHRTRSSSIDIGGASAPCAHPVRYLNNFSRRWSKTKAHMQIGDVLGPPKWAQLPLNRLKGSTEQSQYARTVRAPCLILPHKAASKASILVATHVPSCPEGVSHVCIWPDLAWGGGGDSKFRVWRAIAGCAGLLAMECMKH